MSADLQWMEHRWGTRIELDAPAEIMTLDGSAGIGVVRNASLSGALAETSFRPALLSRVAVRPAAQAGEWLEGCVVRVDGHAVAIEWLDPPLHAVAVLLSLHHALPEAEQGGRESAEEAVVSLLRWRQELTSGP